MMTYCVKVLVSDYVIEIDGIKYRHHLHGGGLVAETAEVSPEAYVGLFASVTGLAKVLDHGVWQCHSH
ncbi:MAG: hypothetical protein UX53_C0049G0004 [Candidatus Azambacteria bacterium GW2011_GWB2_46_37]|uniref:Uncharacterized protein n=1 Tax=Candidatus Azambacteria bacterium GW2011_GWB2_46_37 TaxID=1618618 RepID=A0A0G1SW62_9BACT|nr:MAG: hypothetical protein UX53_C0049G0004 [Candidatus Azambacteria bacterium GW2011_GWB2_46_37]